jgi:hypothetical protein
LAFWTSSKRALLRKSETINSNAFWPTIGLFIEFDRLFLDFNTVDAVAIANWLVSQNIERMVTKDLAGHFSDWRAAPLEQRTQLS